MKERIVQDGADPIDHTALRVLDVNVPAGNGNGKSKITPVVEGGVVVSSVWAKDVIYQLPVTVRTGVQKNY